MTPLIPRERYDLAVLVLIAVPMLVCVGLVGIAWLRRRAMFNRRYRAAIQPMVQPGRPGRVHLRVVGKPVPDDRDSIQQFKRRVN